MFSPPTPCLVVDAMIVQRNIARMQEYANQHGLNLRPHTKTHKSLQVASLQIGAGRVGSALRRWAKPK